MSYYDHVKLTAAVAACFYLYDKEKGTKDYQKEYFSKVNRNIEKLGILKLRAGKKPAQSLYE